LKAIKNLNAILDYWLKQFRWNAIKISCDLIH
jgi:hypothetical protein